VGLAGSLVRPFPGRGPAEGRDRPDRRPRSTQGHDNREVAVKADPARRQARFTLQMRRKQSVA